MCYLSRMKKSTLRERFFRHICADPSGCVLWTGGKNPKGYGYMTIAPGLTRRAHRISWFLKYGRWPIGDLLHSCDTPACVWPPHLREGTNQENIDEMVAKDRHSRGERNAFAKLTELEVSEIRALCTDPLWSYQRIADAFGVARSQIVDIYHREAWKCVPSEMPASPKPTQRPLRPAREGQRYQVGEESLTVAEVAVRAGLTEEAILYRVHAGLTGAALVRPKHRAPRKPYTRRK